MALARPTWSSLLTGRLSICLAGRSCRRQEVVWTVVASRHPNRRHCPTMLHARPGASGDGRSAKSRLPRAWRYRSRPRRGSPGQAAERLGGRIGNRHQRPRVLQDHLEHIGGRWIVFHEEDMEAGQGICGECLPAFHCGNRCVQPGCRRSVAGVTSDSAAIVGASAARKLFSSYLAYRESGLGDIDGQPAQR